MRGTGTATALAAAVAWGGAAAFLICLLVRKVAQYPRCLAVCAAAVPAWWRSASGRRGTATRGT